MPQSYLARQPVFDIDQNVTGYELLFRSDATEPCTVNGNEATTSVLINSYIEIGLDKLVGDQLAFINITRDFILDHDKLPPPSKQLVLEVLANVEANDEIITGIQALIDKGYNVALDDFDFSRPSRRLIQLAHFVKIDILQHSPQEIAKMVTTLRQFPVKLMAEKIETSEQFQRCCHLGFDYYQGFSLCQPRVVRANRIPSNKLQVMQLLAKLHNEDVEVNELSKLIQQDVVLSYKLLRYINSASLALRRKIDSINHAVVLLGRKSIRQWASMIALSTIDVTPDEIIHTALLRAKMCELLLESGDKESAGAAFTVGLFSMLDALIGASIDRLLPMLQLHDDLNEALLHRKGPYGNVLKCVLAYEQGDWQAVDRAGFGEEFTSSCYMRAVEWCDASKSQLMQQAA